MPTHVVVDGSNIATEGRSAPSLKQLNEAVLAFMGEHPDALITVVVDATFGHRIDPKEVAEFDEAVANNELVAPPAGAIGRGDAFVLSIANKVNATILSNDSYQEFHGEYAWLFDEGRLVGGKPVPHIGWVFVNRLPVRGPLSRKSVAEAKRRSGGRGKKGDGSVRVGTPEASRPMPVPTAPPPGATGGRRPPKGASVTADAMVAAVVDAAAPTDKGGHKAPPVNDLLTFLSFVEHHPVGTSVNAVVDHYSSHGAYVKIGEVVGYVPLRLMADPAPRSAREFMKVGESITLVVDNYIAAKRSIDLAVPGMSSAAPAPAEPEKKPARGRKAAAKPVEPAADAVAVEVPAEPKPARGRKKAAAPAAEPTASTAPADKPVADKPAKAAKAAKPAKAPAKKSADKAVEPAAAAPAEKPVKAAKAPAKKAAAKPADPAPAEKPAKATKRAAAPAKKASRTRTPAAAKES